MQFGLIAFAIYYIYQKEDVTEEDVNNTVSEVETEEITNIRLGISNVDNLNPILSTNQNVQDISMLIFEPLLIVTEDYKLDYGLATEWSKADDTSYLITLRENVKWHNGNDFTAEDVKYTIDTIKALGSDYIYYSNVENIENVEIVGTNIIKIYLYQSEELFEYNLTFPIISATFFAGEDITSSEKNNIPMGTGMYKLQSIDMSSQLELKQNTNWWNINEIETKIETIYIKLCSSVSEVYNAYKLGSIDILNTSRNTNIEENIGTIGYNLKENYGREFDYLALNCERDVMSNKEVRQAISYAINKEDIVNTIYGGEYIVADYPLEYGSYLYNSNIETNYEYNSDTAKQILVDNGWTYTDRYWQKKINGSNVRLKITLLVDSSNETRVNVANMIKEDLEEIGIQVNLVSVKGTTYDNYIKNTNYDILLTGVTVGLKPKLSRYFGEGNLANYTNEEALSILEELYNISDTDTLKEKYEILQEIYQEDRAYIGLYFNKTTVIYSNNLAGTVSPNWYNYFYNIETWYRKS